MEEITTIKQKISIPKSDIVFIVPAAGKVNSACNYKLAYEDDGFLNIGTSLAIDEISKKSNNKIVLAVRSKNKKYINLINIKI